GRERVGLKGGGELGQGESSGDLSNSRTALQAKSSLGNLRGALSRGGAVLRESLLFVISRLEAALAFSEEGYEFIARDDARARMASAITETHALADTFRRGHATATGLAAVILG